MNPGRSRRHREFGQWSSSAAKPQAADVLRDRPPRSNPLSFRILPAIAGTGSPRRDSAKKYQRKPLPSPLRGGEQRAPEQNAATVPGNISNVVSSKLAPSASSPLPLAGRGRGWGCRGHCDRVWSQPPTTICARRARATSMPSIAIGVRPDGGGNETQCRLTPTLCNRRHR
jgi:hypothetical protein